MAVPLVSIKQENVMDDHPAPPLQYLSIDFQPPAPKKPTALNERSAKFAQIKRFNLASGVTFEPAIRAVNSKNRSAVADIYVPNPDAVDPPFEVS
jgi:hypothetical protein